MRCAIDQLQAFNYLPVNATPLSSRHEVHPVFITTSADDRKAESVHAFSLQRDHAWGLLSDKRRTTIPPAL